MKFTHLCANPLVVVVDDVFGPEEAEAAIAAGRGALERAVVSDLGGRAVSEARTNTNASIDQWSNPVLATLCEKISGIVRLPPENCEPARLLHYEGAQKFDPHHDAYSEYSPGEALLLRNGGQRLFTTICYLNDADGGETVFPHLKLAVKPRLGRMLVFANTIPGSAERHDHAIHAGTAIKSGEKWVLSLWWRQAIWHVPREYPATEGDILTV